MSLPVRVLHFADIHIGMENYGHLDRATGVNQRVLDFIRGLKTVVDYALDHEADLVIFAGDAFKTRDPNPTILREFSRQLMRLSAAQVPTILLVGNHDMPLIEKRANSVDIFNTLAVPFITVGKTERLHLIETRRGMVQVATAPWPARSRLMASADEYRKLSIEDLDRELERVVGDELQRLASEVDPGLPAILTGHFTVGGAQFGSERNVMIGRDAVISLAALANPAWDYVALGHIHKHQQVNRGSLPPVVYSGSLERIDFGEESDAKGFVWVELVRGQTIWRFVPVSVRPFITIDADATHDGETPTDAVLRAIERHDVTGAVVRVRVKLLHEQEAHFRPKLVEDALAAAHFVASISREVERDARSRIGIENAESLSPLELLDRYFKSRSTSAERTADLLEVAKTLIESQ